MIRVGILGCADIARRSLAPAFACHADFTLAAVASRSPEKARALAAPYGAQTCSYEQLIARDDLDLIYCPLPTGLHYEWVRRALAAGRHVLCEKSLACSEAQVASLVELARQRGVLLMESFQFRFHGQSRLVRRLLDSGRVGDIRRVDVRFSYPRFSDAGNIRFSKRLGGGALLDAGAYAIKATTLLLGTDVQLVSAARTPDSDWEVDKDGSLVFRRPDGVESHASYSMDAAYRCGFVITGTKGTIETTRAFTARADLDAEVIVDGEVQRCRDDHFARMLDVVSERIASADFEPEYEEALMQARLMSDAARRLGLDLVSRYALFGAKGYLGTQLAASFAESGIDVEGYDLPEADVTDSAFWETFDAARYSAVLFFCGRTGPQASDAQTALYTRVNEGGLRALIARLSPLGRAAPKIVFPSSRLVYKGACGLLSEDAATEAKTTYARNKLNGERMLAAAGLPYVVLRIGVPYGSLAGNGGGSYGTVGFMERQAAQGRVTLYGDGGLRRTFTFVGDLCRIVAEVARRSDLEGIFNMGGSGRSLLQVARLVARRRGADVAFVPWPEDAAARESGDTEFDSSRLDRAIAFSGYRAIEDVMATDGA